MSILPLTVHGWLQQYRDGASPRVLLAQCLRRAREASPPATWIYLASDADLERQLAALEALAAGACGPLDLIARLPLYGVPCAVKDNIDIAGVPTTAGCPAFKHLAEASAATVRRLQAAGAIWIGKTNLDQFATGLVGTRSPYGQPSSVFSAEHISGGSSSGSAVAVAAGIVAFALGTDTAGSGRVPAAFNQVVGLKPTPGRVGASGVVPACRTLDCVSIFALSVGDAAHVLSVIEGPDANDCYSAFSPGPAAFGQSGGALRIGVATTLEWHACGGYAAPYAQALAHARALGHSIIPVDFTPLHRTADLLYAGPWVAERYAVVAALLKSAPESLDPSVRAVIAAAERFSAVDAFRAQYTLKALQRQTQVVWDSVDVLLVPTAPGHPRFADVAADPLGANSALGTYTNFVNLLGWCALALPSGTTATGLPFGVTFIAPANHDAALAALGCAWQASLALPLGATGLPLAAASAPPARLCTMAVQDTLPLAVVGAHLSGLPLNGQLLERGARLLQATTTAPRYRLYALPDTTPPKPGLVRVADASSEGHAIKLEVWDMPAANLGSFLALIRAPLGLGSVELADGRWVHGFLCEAHAVAQARDISGFGGWRDFMSAGTPGTSNSGNDRLSS